MLYKKCILSLLSLIIIISCSNNGNKKFQGYMEGEYLYMAPMLSGHLDKLNVSRGQLIESKTQLFMIEQNDALYQVQQAQAQLRSSQATLKDMQSGKRPPELNTIRAQISQAQSSKSLSAVTLKRDQQQFQIGAISKSQLDTSITNYKVAVDRLNELLHDLETAQLPNRTEQIKAQKAMVNYSEASLNDYSWRLAQTITLAPESCLVYDTLYTVGEYVQAGNPVVVLLPAHNLKVRFFVPETVIGSLKLGQRLLINCDACTSKVYARISYISNQAEYTPPVIYSNDTRSQLVFRIEAKPENPDLLSMHPGQPVAVVVQ
ncbi:MAG: HlyD family efflux transporter periplasmic adaptor subunit [Burkholderiales bacterium]|nr:HlyD family efflux transporter periplasmic adaptor subunit [Burkholderiales bacterium]